MRKRIDGLSSKDKTSIMVYKPVKKELEGLTELGSCNSDRVKRLILFYRLKKGEALYMKKGKDL